MDMWTQPPSALDMPSVHYGMVYDDAGEPPIQERSLKNVTRQQKMHASVRGELRMSDYGAHRSDRLGSVEQMRVGSR